MLHFYVDLQVGLPYFRFQNSDVLTIFLIYKITSIITHIRKKVQKTGTDIYRYRVSVSSIGSNVKGTHP